MSSSPWEPPAVAGGAGMGTAGGSPEPGGATAGKWRWTAERETQEERNLWVQMDPGQAEGEGWFINGKETERKHSRTEWTGGEICRDVLG